MEVEGEEGRNTNVPSLGSTQTPSTGLRHPSFLPLEEGAGKRCSECGQYLV